LAATAIYLAQKSIVREAMYSRIEIFVDNPWGDRPPQQFKHLATVEYHPSSGGAPTIDLSERAATPAELEYDELDAELYDRQFCQILDASPTSWTPKRVSRLSGNTSCPVSGSRP
jgi:hypothetical protein